MHKNVFLSICIPTYNRADKVSGLVNSILTFPDDTIEVVILDNRSTDHTENIFSQITDNRVRYIRHSENIGAVVNVMTALNYGRGQYSLLCLDKDRVDPAGIHLFMERVKEDSEVVLGQCQLNNNEVSLDQVFEKGYPSLLKMAYISEHPSGMFVKSSILSETGVIAKLLNEDKSFAFTPDLLKAELSMYGKSRRVNIPFVNTETLEECEIEPSHTYKGDNIYFSPQNVISRFNRYIANLYQLNLSKGEQKSLARKIYISNLNASTFGYQTIMQNKSICSHHGISTRRVSNREILMIALKYNLNYLSSKVPEELLYKLKNTIVSYRDIVKSIIRNSRINANRSGKKMLLN